MYQVCRKSVNLFEIRYLADKHTGVLTIPVPPASIYLYIYIQVKYIQNTISVNICYRRTSETCKVSAIKCTLTAMSYYHSQQYENEESIAR